MDKWYRVRVRVGVGVRVRAREYTHYFFSLFFIEVFSLTLNKALIRPLFWP